MLAKMFSQLARTYHLRKAHRVVICGDATSGAGCDLIKVHARNFEASDLRLVYFEQSECTRLI